jgi:glutathione S-transferase
MATAGGDTRHGATLWLESLIKPLFGGKPDVGLVDNAKTSFRLVRTA